MREPLVIAVAQPPSTACDVGANALAHAAAIREARASVVVFPELSLTGYELDAPTVAVDDARLAPIVEACAETGSLALVGAPVEGEGGKVHIGMLAIDGDRTKIVYRKMWLGGAEPDRFSPGTEPTVLEIDGWRLGLAICKDTGVPQHAADTAALGMDVYVAGVLEAEEDSAVPSERARRVALDHHVWVATASFAGSTGGCYDRAAGGSGIWSPDAAVVGEAGAETGAVVRATIGERG
jgi:predicted amidohydrolase